MYLLDGTVMLSPSDLSSATSCEFAVARKVDAMLGRVPRVITDDPMLDRTARLGDVHEQRVLERYRNEFGDAVALIDRPRSAVDRAEIDRVVADTRAAFAAGAPVVFQAAFIDGDFIGYADFIVRDPDGRYRVQDTKLARRAKVPALLQLAAYADQLDRLGVPRSDTVELILGDGSISRHRVADIAPVYRLRRQRLRDLVTDRIADSEAVTWGDESVGACGRCDTCAPEVAAHRDLLLVAGMRPTVREKLIASGITTIDELAGVRDAVPGIPAAASAAWSAQARVQIAGERREPGAPPPFEVSDPSALAAVPPVSPGDLFFDFEGDPLYTEDGTRWGLDYLFGVLDSHERYTGIWAHSLDEEREALLRFLELVAAARAVDPDLHIFHYASYERTHLATIASRHGVGVEAVDDLLRSGVLVDLYPIVKRAIVLGERSYSIKKLEAITMADHHRASAVTAGGDSIAAYVHARELRDVEIDPESGDPGSVAAERHFAELADYNRDDVISTLRLRDWLVALAAEHDVEPAPRPEPHPDPKPENPLAIALTERAGARESRGPDETALALAAAAIDFFPREHKSFWWAHFARLEQPVDDWADERDVFVVDPLTSATIEPWYQEGRGQPRRTLRLRGTLAPGSKLGIGSTAFALYDPPAPFPSPDVPPLSRVTRSVTVVAVHEAPGTGPLGAAGDAGPAELALDVVESTPRGAAPWDELPMALTPGSPPPHNRLSAAIAEWAEPIAAATSGSEPETAALTLLRRRAPRRLPDRAWPQFGTGDPVDEVTAAMLALDDSTLAVQGPPGTGKTYLATHVIARLVRDHGWRIGVVAQSHAVVDNVLDRLVAMEGGLDPDVVGKYTEQPDLHRYTVVPRAGVRSFIESHPDGCVIGGTAWDFANDERVPRASLDALVVDEAGQFSLAMTIAVSVAARNLLLLGDPQQLPQVTQGVHPEPVDGSALGWLAGGTAVLDPRFGLFLPTSRRMRPELAAEVSALSYDGELAAHATTTTRSIAGIAPGLVPVPVAHRGRTSESPEEVAEVVRIVRDLVGREFRDGDESRPLSDRDIIVVTPFNAQLALVAQALDLAGFPDVPVGTVDKFQGQEAAVAIVTLAASSAADVPRGLDFVLSRNRLNVAISRAQVVAYLISSPALLDHVPTKPETLALLSSFARLTGAA